MKAKLLQEVEISQNEILPIGLEVEVISSYCGCNGSYYVCELSNYRQVEIEFSKLEITDWHPYIDWEKRRYEIAKIAMNGILSNENEVEYAYRKATYEKNEAHTTPKAVAQLAVAFADSLISELKKGGGQ